MTQNRETFSKGSPGSNNMIVGIRRFSALRAAGPRIWEPWRFRAVRRASARRAGSGRTRPFPVRDIFRGTDRTPVRHGSHGPWDRRRTAVYRHRPSLRAGPTAGRASSPASRRSERHRPRPAQTPIRPSALHRSWRSRRTTAGTR